jgi:hypothetical protein
MTDGDTAATAGGGTSAADLVRRVDELLSRPSPLGWAVTLVLVLAALALPKLPTHTNPAPAMDEGLLLVEPERVLEGDLPNRDFESFYGPLNTYVLAAVYAASEPDVTAERVVGLAYDMAIIAGVFALASFGGVVLAVAAAVIAAAILFTQGLTAFAYFGGIALAIFGLYLLARAATVPGARGRLFVLAGVLAGLAVSYRPQFGLALALGAVPLLLGYRADAFKRVAIGLGIGLLPLIVHTILAGPAAVFENLVVDALFRSGPQSTQPLIPEQPAEARLAALVAIAVAGLAVCAVLLWRRAPRSPDARRIGAIALFTLGLVPQAIGRLEAIHIIHVGCVAVPLLPYALAAAMGREWMRPVRSLLPVAAVGVLVLALAWTYVQPMKNGYGRAKQWPPWAEDAGADLRSADYGSRSFPLSTEQEAVEAEQTVEVVDSITEPGDSIIVGSDDLTQTFYNDTYLYHLLPDLEPGTYYLTLAPGTANGDQSKLPAEVAEADVVVLGTLPALEQLLPNAEPGNPAAQQVLEQHFCLRANFFVHLIYERCR